MEKERKPRSKGIRFQRLAASHGRQLGGTVLGWPGVSLSIHNMSRSHVDTIVSGRLCRPLSILHKCLICMDLNSSGVLCMWVKQPWRQTYVCLLEPTHNAQMVHEEEYQFTSCFWFQIQSRLSYCFNE